MSRNLLPFAVADIAALAKALRSQLAQFETVPGHLTLLNMLARAAGYRNFQHFRSQALSDAVLSGIVAEAPAKPAEPAIDARTLTKLLRYFDESGRLVRWPSKYSHQLPCLWTLWAAMPARQVFDEMDITRWLAGRSLFGDPTLLRRELCDQGMVTRTRDGREYRRVERRPSPEGLALIQKLGRSPIVPSAAHPGLA